jgi:hypothetical protein
VFPVAGKATAKSCVPHAEGTHHDPPTSTLRNVVVRSACLLVF